MGIPVEIYLYGTQYMVTNVTYIFIFAIAGIFYLPVYYKLQLNSVFEVCITFYDSTHKIDVMK
jgi:hypothetical protein